MLIKNIRNQILFAVLFTFTVFADQTIVVSSFSFAPTTATIEIGEKIIFSFINGSHNARTLTVPVGASSYISDAVSNVVRTVDFIPTVAGTYTFDCAPHPQMVFSLTVLNAPIIISSPTSTVFCSGNVVSFTQTTTGTFLGGNVFNVELSNSSGSFSSPTVILPTISGANVQFEVPNATAGSGYRFRLVSTNPVKQSNNNGTNISLNVSQNPTVSISSNATGSICTNTPITITASTLNTSGVINYSWKINNSMLGTNANTLTTNLLQNGDQIICIITAQPSGCGGAALIVTSNSITSSILTNVIPTISISGFRNYPPYCSESITTISSNISGGGTSPSLTWKIINSSGSTIIGSNFNSTTLGMFAGTVQANLTSSLSCASPISVTSNVLVFESGLFTTDAWILNVTSTGSTLFTFGVPPIHQIFHWYYNNEIILTTATSIIRTISGIYSVKYSDHGCPAISPNYNFQFNPTSITPIIEEKSKITIYPNPAKEKITVASAGGIKKSGLKILIFDSNNKTVLNSTFYEGVCEGGKGKDCLCPGTSEIDISSLANGLYFVRILDAKTTIFNQKLVKE